VPPESASRAPGAWPRLSHADRSALFLDNTGSYGVIAAHRPGEVFATEVFAGRIDRIVDRDLDGIADAVTEYASGLSLDVNYGMAFDDADVLYTVAGGDRVLALPDADGDFAADLQVQFSPLLGHLAGIGFGAGPPEEVSPPGSYRPVGVVRSAAGLRLSWEDQGAAVPAYNIYEGTLGSTGSHRPLLCRVTGTPDGTGGRVLDFAPSDDGDHYYLVTSSDHCGEGPAGRASGGRLRSFPFGRCGAAP
jgi:hypothetical protein